MARVTLDSNVYISALNFGGIPVRTLHMAVEGDIEIAISEPVIAEVVRVLTDKFEWPPERVAHADGMMRKLGTCIRGVVVVLRRRGTPFIRQYRAYAAQGS